MAALASRRKSVVRWIVALVLAVDCALLAYNTFRQVPTADQQRQVENEVGADLVRIREDVKAAQNIHDHLGDVRKQSDDFFQRELRPAAKGYSGIDGDLNGVAREAGLHLSGLNFTQREIADRGVEEIEISGNVEGAYPNLVSFINGLERSESFYVLESLELASASGSELRMNIRLKTYFRTQG
jgi:Tfp pilus assembly protein PilO